MTHSTLRRTIVGAAITVLLSTVALAPASAAPTSSDPVTPTLTRATISDSVTTWTLKGFYKPVKMDGVWNKVKAGSTVPFKFKVYNGTTKLKGAGVVATFMAQPVSCTDPATIAGPSVEVASARKGFQLKYRSGAFHQNWKTPKAAKAAKHSMKPVATTTCYQVTMTTVDGQALTALFRLK